MKMNSRKTIVFGFVLMFIVSTASADVRVEGVSLDPTHIEPGDEVDVNIKVYRATEKIDVYGGTERSGSTGVIKDDPDLFYKAELVGKDDASKKYVMILDGEKNIGHLFFGESWTTPFKVMVKADAPAADYTLEYRLYETNPSYQPTGGIKSYEFKLPVEGLVKYSVTSDESLELGSTGSLGLKISNVGGGNARQVSVILNASSPITILSSSEAYAGNLAGISSKELTYMVSVASSATPGAYEIPIQIKYINSVGTEVTVKKTLGVEVTGTPGISVMLDSAEVLKKGGKGVVSLSVINNGFIDTKFLNLNILETGDYEVQAPSEIYIGNLASDDFESHDFTIQVSDSAKEGPLPLKVVVEYRKENSNKIERVEQTVEVNVLSEKEYAESVKSNGGGLGTLSMILALPALVVAYILLWFIVKIVGVITNYLNRKVFKRGVE